MLESSLFKNHVKACKEKNLDPHEELSKSRKEIDNIFSNMPKTQKQKKEANIDQEKKIEPKMKHQVQILKEEINQNEIEEIKFTEQMLEKPSITLMPQFGALSNINQDQDNRIYPKSKPKK